MINIAMCSSCNNQFRQPHGQCPIHLKIQEGMDVIDKAMVSANSSPGLLSVVTSDHWLGHCSFDCRYFEKKDGVGN